MKIVDGINLSRFRQITDLDGEIRRMIKPIRSFFEDDRRTVLRDNVRFRLLESETHRQRIRYPVVFRLLARRKKRHDREAVVPHGVERQLESGTASHGFQETPADTLSLVPFETIWKALTEFRTRASVIADPSRLTS